jgi:hypothetical protein
MLNSTHREGEVVPEVDDHRELPSSAAAARDFVS